jgi:hypothetical protein
MAWSSALQWRRTAQALLLGAAAVQLNFVGTPALATTAPSEVAQALPQGQLIGTGRMRYLFWDVFDAALWVPPGFAAPRYFDHPFALELRYLRKFSGAELVASSLQEMRRVRGLDPAKEMAWSAAMRSAFPDVEPGDRITGVHRPGVGVRFFVNGRLQAVVDDADFARAFFGIWLSPDTSEPRLRSALLQGGAS